MNIVKHSSKYSQYTQCAHFFPEAICFLNVRLKFLILMFNSHSIIARINLIVSNIIAEVHVLIIFMFIITLTITVIRHNIKTEVMKI